MALVSDNPEPCTCGHSLLDHRTGDKWGRGECLICTRTGGGCKGYRKAESFTKNKANNTHLNKDAFRAFEQRMAAVLEAHPKNVPSTIVLDDDDFVCGHCSVSVYAKGNGFVHG